MDAFAVAIASGITLKTVGFRQTFRLSWHFGLFQAMMPVIGWAAGLSIRETIEAYDHWVAFALLAFVGGGMIKGALFGDESDRRDKDPTRGMTMVMLSIATSIDALAVGLSLSVLNVSIWTPALVIGIVAGSFTIIGLHLGKKVGSAQRLSFYAELIGGLVLFAIGFNILREHSVFDNLF
jgi:putative Mn2+ efflux pump MntP